MQNTIKLFLILTLFCSAVSVSFADEGEQTNGGRCTVNCPAPPADPTTGTGESVAGNTAESTIADSINEESGEISIYNEVLSLTNLIVSILT